MEREIGEHERSCTTISIRPKSRNSQVEEKGMLANKPEFYKSSNMRGLARSLGRTSRNIFLLELLLCAVLIQCIAVPTNAPTTYYTNGRRMNEMAEQEGSIARFRQLIIHEEFSLRNLLQVDKDKVDEHQHVRQEKVAEQEVKEQTKELKRLDEKNAEEQPHSQLDLGPDISLDEFQLEGNAVVFEDLEKVDEGERQTEENSNQDLKPQHSEKSKEHEELTEVEGKPDTEERQQQKEEDNSPEETNSSEEEKEEPFVFPEPYLLGPTIKDWDEQRASWLNGSSKMKTTPDGKPRVLIVTGSQPEPCSSSLGDNFHIRSLKVKIDYARMHNYEIYYNLAWLDPLFGGFWVKLPTMRTLMLAHPEIEWFFWVDSDAMFTDMLFEAPWETYEDYNMIMWGMNDVFYSEKHWTAFNAGVFIIRNCQWTLDLIDKWSPMGPLGPVRDAYGQILSSVIKGRNEVAADDQSALAYLMITDEAVKAKVKLVDSPAYMISGWWVPIVETFEDIMEKYYPGLGNHRWPWITHFTGCGPCHHSGDKTPQSERCIKNIDRAFNFADNQVLAYMGFQHQSLSSPEVIRWRNETDRPLELLGVNPWAERIAEFAAGSTS